MLRSRLIKIQEATRKPQTRLRPGSNRAGPRQVTGTRDNTFDPEATERFGRTMRDNIQSGDAPFGKAYIRAVIDRIEVDDRVSALSETKTFWNKQLMAVSWPQACSQMCTEVVLPSEAEQPKQNK